MDLVRSWLGQALRATGAAVVVPIAVLVALSISAVGGGSGLGGLGSISQIVSGPRLAGSDLTVDSGESEISDAVTQLAAEPAPDGSGPSGPSVPGDGTAPVPDSGTGGGGDDDGGGGGQGPGGSVPPPGGGDGPAPPPPGGGGGGGGETPPPGQEPGVVDGIAEGVQDVTDGTPVAPTVEDAVDTLIETCGRLGCP